MADSCYGSCVSDPDCIYIAMLRQAIRNLPGLPFLIKLNTDIEDRWFDFRWPFLSLEEAGHGYRVYRSRNSAWLAVAS